MIVSQHIQEQLYTFNKYKREFTFWIRELNNKWEKSNNYFAQAIYFLLIGIKHSHYWNIFYHDFNGRDLKKIRFNSSHRKENLSELFRLINIRKLLKIKIRWKISDNVKHIVMGDFNFKLIESFPELDDMARSLKLCSAERSDLVDLFAEGKMLRFSILHKGVVVGTVAIYPSSCLGRFYFYGLGNRHINIHEDFIRKGLAPDLLAGYHNFKNIVYDQKISYEGVKLTKENSFNPYWNND
jgi:hypothetical protein